VHRVARVAALIALALLPAAAHAARGPFQSPSGNIGCIVDTSYGARCDIANKDWSRGPRPKGCPTFTDWGQGLIVGKTGKGHIVCAGDTALSNGGGTLGYGKSKSAGRFTCTSRTSGVTCRNTRNNHGFFISKQKYRLF
jgi:hypothetical protein